MARYSRTLGRWFGRGRSNPPLSEANRDDRQWQTELPGGLVRIDMGSPTKRLASEPQAVEVRRQRHDPPSPAVDPTAIIDSTVGLPSDPPQRPKGKPRRSAFSED